LKFVVICVYPEECHVNFDWTLVGMVTQVMQELPKAIQRTSLLLSVLAVEEEPKKN
jgi:hypothetical protein